MRFYVGGVLKIAIPKEMVMRKIEEVRSRLDELRVSSVFFAEVDEVEDYVIERYALAKVIGEAMWDRYHLDWDLDTDGCEDGLFYNEDMRSITGYVTEWDYRETESEYIAELKIEINSPYYAMLYPQEFAKLLRDVYDVEMWRRPLTLPKS